MKSISNLWHSDSEIEWKGALNNYWSYVRKENIDLEKELNDLKISEIQTLNKYEWYDFLYYKYFRWKYTMPNRYATTTNNLCRYKEMNQLDNLYDIKIRLLSNDVFNVHLGLSIAMGIRGLGIAGASGLLSLMYPDIYGTVDQFLVKALKNIDNLSKSDLNELQKIKLIKTKKPGDEIYNIKLENGIFLIDLMSRKAKSLNEKFNTNFWTPRRIDMILWSAR